MYGLTDHRMPPFSMSGELLNITHGIINKIFTVVISPEG